MDISPMLKTIIEMQFPEAHDNLKTHELMKDPAEEEITRPSAQIH